MKFKQYLKLLILVEKDLNKQKNDELSKLRQKKGNLFSVIPQMNLGIQYNNFNRL
jgi:hypothetical protein